ncbi:MAG TPA: alpha-amylase family glycosyl hydrolase, partial [Dermatophilaceae bacterium]
MARPPSLSAAAVAVAIALVGGLAPVSLATSAGAATAAPTAVPAAPAPRTATLVGSLQSEAGCEGDWAPDCAATELVREGDSTAYSKELEVPAGTFVFKVAINKTWDESYGADGARGGADIPLVLAGPARLKFSYDDVTHKIGVAPTDLPGQATAADKALAGSSLRPPLTSEQFYFLMADRFANGSTANDQGGLTGSRLETGYDPADKGFYHGGDLAGVKTKLDYIKSLGTTSIWLTPTFKNQPVQGTGVDASAGYHGYWITDFTQIDPHLGTNDDMKALIAAAHAKGMKVFFDIITNHTADVIDYAQKQYGYISTATKPYTDAAGNVFDPKAVVNSPSFPTLSAATSFPYTPVFR